jgi:hypothetical protein
MRGNFAMESVASFAWNRWQLSYGTGGNFRAEYAPDSRAAQSAIQGLQGKELGGRTLNVNEAKPREPRREPRQARW